jgi:hypothetical protein
MKRKIWLLTLMLALICGQAAWAQDMYVVAVGGVGTKINSVPYTISAPGFYYLGGNLTHTGTTHGITVNADDVTLDLMGFSLSHTGAIGAEIGIVMNGRTNVEIRNGTVRGFFNGIQETLATGNKHRVINVRATNNSRNGIVLNGNNHLVKGCNVCNNGPIGISISNGIIADCVAANNGSIGIALNGTGSVLGNSAINNTDRNFSLGAGGATSILVDRNNAFGLNPNYFVTPGTTGVVITANNSGTP